MLRNIQSFRLSILFPPYSMKINQYRAAVTCSASFFPFFAPWRATRIFRFFQISLDVLAAACRVQAYALCARFLDSSAAPHSRGLTPRRITSDLLSLLTAVTKDCAYRLFHKLVPLLIFSIAKSDQDETNGYSQELFQGEQNLLLPKGGQNTSSVLEFQTVIYQGKCRNRVLLSRWTWECDWVFDPTPTWA